ncbi:MAG: DNA (cytosine-5-)-methyltransferase [Spirochaetales bacterium]|nr:DNA (cytosine-5-)-methyltransferase [Spirochaetales bacterium]
MKNDSAILEKLEQVKRFYSVPEIADELEVNATTIYRWLNRQAEPKPYVTDRLFNMLNKYLKNETEKKSFSFIDLFAGIGGMRRGFENAGGECVFTSEWNDYAQKTYLSNFPEIEKIHGDITKIDVNEIPDHDVLLAGFPCQPFSIAGVSKKKALGRAHGFLDETQGTLFFDVARIIETKKPKAFVLENVKNLKSHDKGKTFEIITGTLQQELGYTLDFKVIDGQHWVPQHRERIVIVGLREPRDFSLENLKLPNKNEIKLGSILHRTVATEPWLDHDEDKYFDFKNNKVQSKYTLTDHLWEYLQAYAAKHRSMGNGFGFGLVTEESVTRTLSARYYKDGSEILVDQGKRKNPRRLTPRECARLMGFPDDFIIPVSDTRAYQQFGNSVVVPMFSEVAKFLKPLIVHDEIKN